MVNLKVWRAVEVAVSGRAKVLIEEVELGRFCQFEFSKPHVAFI
jgi:hypothetical protein